MGSGKFIVFEGVDNSGKTTVAAKIKKWLEGKDKKVVLTGHPGSTALGKEIRHMLKHSPHPINPNAQALLFAADNSMFGHQILAPELAKGSWVLGDRNNFISSLAYQIASGCSFEELDRIHDATNQTNKIDLLFIFRCTWEESQKRRGIKGDTTPDRYEDGGRAYFNKLSDCYEWIIEKQPERLTKFVKSQDQINCHYIDANQESNLVFEDVKKIILQYDWHLG